jgi:molecular chaperone HtpG
MDGPIDNHFVNTLEQKFENSAFVRVDSDVVDKLIKKEDALPSKLTEEEQNKIKPVFDEVVGKDNFTIVFESLSETDLPLQITRPEFMRRMKDMSAMGGMSYMGSLPDAYNLVVNSNHPLISKINSNESADENKQLVKQLFDLARLSQNLLKGEDLTGFIKRSINLIEQ